MVVGRARSCVAAARLCRDVQPMPAVCWVAEIPGHTHRLRGTIVGMTEEKLKHLSRNLEEAHAASNEKYKELDDQLVRRQKLQRVRERVVSKNSNVFCC